MSPPDEPLVPSPPPDSGGGCAGCLMALGGGAAAYFGLLIVVSIVGPTPYALGAGLSALFVVSGYMLFLPSARRRRWIRKRRLRRLIRRRPLPGARLEPETLSLPLSVFEGEPRPTTVDTSDAQGMHEAVAEARRAGGLRPGPTGVALRVHLSALPARRRRLERFIERLGPIARWLAATPDPRAAWYTALVTGERQDPGVVGEALERLVAHAPDAPSTRRVVDQALGHPDPRFRLSAALAVHDAPTLEALCDPAIVDALSAEALLALVRGRIAAGDDAALLAHPHAAIRLAWLLETPEPDGPSLVALAGDPFMVTRAIAWVVAERLASDARLPAARRILRAVDARLEHPLVAHAIVNTVDAQHDPIPWALAHLGAEGGIEDVRHVAALLDHPMHRRAARRARARMHTRLGDRIETGHLSLPTEQAGGQLSLDPDVDGRLSVPVDTDG